MPKCAVQKARPNVIGLTMPRELLAEVDAIVASYHNAIPRSAVLRGLILRGLRARAAERSTHVGAADL